MIIVLRICPSKLYLRPALLAAAAGFALLPIHPARAEGEGRDPSSVPSWAAEAVWYQIFPERFRNGDPGNDPSPADMEGSWPHETPGLWRVSDWKGDWYALQEWERDPGKGFFHTVQQRRYGGDLQGVLDKLDYLAELGITAIYFNPLFESPSLHKYDAAMYHHIDNNFGPDPAGDRLIWAAENPADPATWRWTSADSLFLRLIAEAHRRGIRIIIDGVFNHAGITFWAFRDVRRRGAASPYADWFRIRQWDDPATPGDEFDYEGWYGVRELPEFREDDGGIVPGPREHIRHVVRRWMDPNGDGDPSDGVDGWRLDVAEMVAVPFWREFRTWVRSLNPEAYLVGEVWWEDWNAEKMFNAEPWLRGDVFDAVMNYRWAREAGRFFKADRHRIGAPEFDARLARLRADYRPEVNGVLLNLLDSHDTDRLASQIVNRDALYDKGTGVSDNRAYAVRKPDARERSIQKLMVLHQMTYVGAPCVYYGDEAGMWGADDPDCRKPMLWADAAYTPEVSHPFGLERPADDNTFDADLFAYYAEAIRLRKSFPALRLGSVETVLADGRSNLLVYLRVLPSQRVLTALNPGDGAAACILTEKALGGGRLIRVFGEGSAEPAPGGVSVTIPGRSGSVFRVAP
ncbi:MAG: glycoside hydrolase family 13 protein [Bacteroidota bacterium]